MPELIRVSALAFSFCSTIDIVMDWMTSVTHLFPKNLAFKQRLTNRSQTFYCECFKSVILPSNCLLIWMFFDQIAAQFQYVLCQLFLSSKNFLPMSLVIVHVKPLGALNCNFATICVQLLYPFQYKLLWYLEIWTNKSIALSHLFFRLIFSAKKTI